MSSENDNVIELPKDADGVLWTGKEHMCLNPYGDAVKILSFTLKDIDGELIWFIDVKGSLVRADRCLHTKETDSLELIINDLTDQAYIISQIKDSEDPNSVAYNLCKNLWDIITRMRKLQKVNQNEIGPKTREALARAIEKGM